MMGPDTVVFLDIDRVCNNATSRRRMVEPRIETDPVKAKRAAISTLLPELVGRVQRVCDEARAAVVIVSGWRRRMGCDEVTAALRAAGLAAPLLGFIPEVTGAEVPAGDDGRCAGARAWLDAHPEVTRWVVIDDGRDFWAGEAEGRRVHPVDGISDEDVAAAIAALGGGAAR